MHAYKRDLMLATVATIGENIRRLRELAGFRSPTDFARALGATPQSVSDWEKDRRKTVDARTLLRLASTLHCTVDDLLQGVNPAYDEIRQNIKKETARDLARQLSGLQGSLPREGGSDVPASAESTDRGLKLAEPQLDVVAETREIASRLFKLAGELAAQLEDRKVAQPQPGLHRRARKSRG